MEETTVKSFFAVWGQTDEAEMKAALTPIMAAEFSFVDPKTDAPITTVEALVTYLAKFGTMMPGGSAKPVTIHHHSSCVRATLDFCMGEKTMMRGQYFCSLDDNGKIRLMAGFVGTGEPKVEALDKDSGGEKKKDGEKEETGGDRKRKAEEESS